MKIICDQCEYIIDRDKYVNNHLVEKYENVYGTNCPMCGKLIGPLKKGFLNTDKELKMEILKNEMIEKLRKNIKGDK